jgi:hypothetical protein
LSVKSKTPKYTTERAKWYSTFLIVSTMLGLSLVVLACSGTQRPEAQPADDTAAVSTGAGSTDTGSTDTADCCSCRFTDFKKFSASEILPCDFDYPAPWQAVAGDDGATVNAVAGAQCAAACPVSPGLGFSVAKKPNANAESMEEVWTQAMRVVGSARCGGRVVTFFSLPGSEPDGQTGGLRFHVGHGGESYGANATFTCPGSGEWLEVQELFINSFKTNEDTTFEGM